MSSNCNRWKPSKRRNPEPNPKSARTVRAQGHIGNQGASAARAAHVDARAQTLGQRPSLLHAERFGLEVWGKRDGQI